MVLPPRVPQRLQEVCGHAQLRRRTAPEKISGRGRHDRDVGTELPDRRDQLLVASIEQVSIQHECVVPGPLELRLRVCELER